MRLAAAANLTELSRAAGLAAVKEYGEIVEFWPSCACRTFLLSGYRPNGRRSRYVHVRVPCAAHRAARRPSRRRAGATA